LRLPEGAKNYIRPGYPRWNNLTTTLETGQSGRLSNFTLSCDAQRHHEMLENVTSDDVYSGKRQDMLEGKT